jgi:hypothetical protein
MRQTRVTPLRSLAATDASGGVARQQKITHAHESPFYHYAQFPHPFAITYRGKKYSRILFGQTSYLLSRFHMPAFNGSLMSFIILEAKGILDTAAVLVLH